jgi:hypothetical protein
MTMLITDLHPEHRQYIGAGRAGKAGGQVRKILVPNEAIAADVVASLKQLAGVSNIVSRRDINGVTQQAVEWLE